MASGAGRYRSRLFGLLSRQTRRWVDKSDRALRHLGVGVTWGAQILLFPVYLMVQAARVAGRQLKQAVRETDELQLPPADMPIQRVLETAVALSPLFELSGDVQNGNAIANLAIRDREIQGIATSLENRALVLVNSHNQVAGNFTAEQQQEIQKLITLEVSDYLHQSILAEEAKAKLINQLPPLEDRPHLLPPIRWFRKVISWVQTGPVASLVNLFQEENLVVNLEARTQQLKLKSQQLKEQNEQLELKSQQLISERTSQIVAPFNSSETVEISPNSLIAKIDGALAKLEAENLAVVSKVTTSITHRGQEFLQIVKTRFHDSPAIELPAGEMENSQAHQFRIQDLIKAAVDYFFGLDDANKLSGEARTAIGYAPPSTKESNIYAEDPWLTAEELFASSLPNQTKQSYAEAFPNLKQPLKKKISPVTSPIDSDYPGEISIGNIVVSNGKDDFQTTQKNSRQSEPYPPQPSSQKKNRKNGLTSDRKSDRSPSPNYNSTSITPNKKNSPSSYQSQSLPNEDLDDDAESDWIEIQAKPVGYVKHPLEQILEWLDLAMLWLEELLLKVWQQFKQLFAGKK
ncbi:MAG TPA: hypothetical protein V6D28_21940 [Leptolyngbyaceae cyanobacterium]